MKLDSTLKNLLPKLKFYSLALDESTDLTDTVQIAIFNGIYEAFNVAEELAPLYPLKGTKS